MDSFNKSLKKNKNKKNKGKLKNEKTMSDLGSPINNGKINKNSVSMKINLSNNSKAKIKNKDISMKPYNIMNKLKNIEVNNKKKDQKGIRKKMLK